MTEAVDWQRLASLLESSTDKVVVILPGGQALVLTSLDHYEGLLKSGSVVKPLVTSKPILSKSSLAKPQKKRGRPPKVKIDSLTEPVHRPTTQPNLGTLEDIGGVAGSLEEEADYYPEPL